MAPIISKNKMRSRDSVRSGSRHTTPGSTISASVASPTPTITAFLEIPIGNLGVPTNIKYDDILERHGGNGGIPDPKHLETIANDLRTLAALARTRSEFNDGGMRELAKRRKEAVEEGRERERESREREKRDRDRDREREKESAARKDVEMEDVPPEKKNGKARRKERSAVRGEEKAQQQERPLNHGAHGVARQDGLDLPVAGELDEENERLEMEMARMMRKWGKDELRIARVLRELFGKRIANTSQASPSRAASRTSKEASSPLPKPHDSGDSSSLSEASPVPSPSTATHPPPELVPPTRASSASSSSSSSDDRQPPQSASIPQYQTFGSNPLIFDDPTVYEVRQITDDMTDEEKKEIYCVASFPKDDLADLIAGTPPNKDFSNAVKPNNQVQAHTFAGYLDGYLRPLKEEDIGFMNERGDRVTPFLMPRRGKRHYTEVWAEEDGAMVVDSASDKFSPNQPRGAIDQMDDSMAETDQISGGPLLNRLLSTMRFEHRVPPEERNQTNGDLPNGDLPNHANEQEESKTAPIASATALPDSTKPPNSALTHAQIDERLKMELRHIGFLSPEHEPDYDAHYDDEVAERLRYLQSRLKEVSVLNGARKQRILELAEEQMAHQEYSTILEDLDSQVQQAYLKRARTAGKSKKNVKRPGGPGGGSHYVGGLGSGGISKPGIGDVAKQLMNRRARWESQIGTVFEGVSRRVRTEGDSIFTPSVMERLMRQERDRFDEEAE